jgi:hypothetical protein
VFTINVDLSELTQLLNLNDELKSTSAEVVRDLAAMTHAKSVELAGERLKTRRKMFVDALSYHQVSEDTWVVSLKASARWIDDGQPAHSMLDAFLASPKAKRAADGSKYLVVPFDHSPGQGPTNTTPPEQDLINTIKGKLKERGIPFGKVETDAAGRAKIGKLHSFSIMDAPLKTADVPGQGRGPVGQVRQGPTGIPLLEGVNVYQGQDQRGKTKRSILTFRVASSKHADQQRWEHPGSPAVSILDDAATWAVDTFDREIAPAVLAKVMIDLSG